MLAPTEVANDPPQPIRAIRPIAQEAWTVRVVALACCVPNCQTIERESTAYRSGWWTADRPVQGRTRIDMCPEHARMSAKIHKKHGFKMPKGWKP